MRIADRAVLHLIRCGSPATLSKEDGRWKTPHHSLRSRKHRKRGDLTSAFECLLALVSKRHSSPRWPCPFRKSKNSFAMRMILSSWLDSRDSDCETGLVPLLRIGSGSRSIEKRRKWFLNHPNTSLTFLVTHFDTIATKRTRTSLSHYLPESQGHGEGSRCNTRTNPAATVLHAVVEMIAEINVWQRGWTNYFKSVTPELRSALSTLTSWPSSQRIFRGEVSVPTAHRQANRSMLTSTTLVSNAYERICALP